MAPGFQKYRKFCKKLLAGGNLIYYCETNLVKYTKCKHVVVFLLMSDTVVVIIETFLPEIDLFGHYVRHMGLNLSH